MNVRYISHDRFCRFIYTLAFQTVVLQFVPAFDCQNIGLTTELKTLVFVGDLEIMLLDPGAASQFYHTLAIVHLRVGSVLVLYVVCEDVVCLDIS